MRLPDYVGQWVKPCTGAVSVRANTMDDPAGLGTHGLGLWAGPMAQGPGPWAQALGTPYMGYMGYMGPYGPGGLRALVYMRVYWAHMGWAGPYGLGLYGPIWAIWAQEGPGGLRARCWERAFWACIGPYGPIWAIWAGRAQEGSGP